MHRTPNYRLKKYLESKGISQTAAATKMQMDRTYLNQVLNDKKPLNGYFLWHFWQTFAWPKSKNFLPDANDMLSDIAQDIVN